MHYLFLFFVTVSTGLLGATLYFYFFSGEMYMHAILGLSTTVSLLLLHCWVFLYFIGTGQGIREGVLAFDLDKAAIKKTKRFKGMTFPFALFSMVFAIVATILGGGISTKSVSPGTHAIFVYVAVAFNAFSFWQEYRVIQRNRKLMQELNDQIEKLQDDAGKRE